MLERIESEKEILVRKNCQKSLALNYSKLETN